MPPADDNLLELYLRYVGTSEVPPQYHHWCLLSAVAASVSNRVWFQKGAKRLAPNLYVSLIGPSGLGKNEAIDQMLDVIGACPRVNVFRGKITAPSMLDLLATPAKSGRTPHSHQYLVTPELSWSMGKGEWADGLIKQLTELYGGSTVGMRESTRTSGTRRIPAGELCINWISGSTFAWLNQTIPQDAISGGFFGRVVAIPAEYNFALRYPLPILPPDWAELRDTLRLRFRILSVLAGEFTMTPEAAAIHMAWYNGRPEPSDPDLMAAWKRQPDFVLKLAMLLTLCDAPDLSISAPTVATAQRLSDHVLRKMTQVVSISQMTPETRGLDVAAQFFRRFSGVVPHTAYLKHMTNKGFDAMTANRVSATLIEMRVLTSLPSPNGRGRSYRWKGAEMRYPVPPTPSSNGYHGESVIDPTQEIGYE